MADSNGKRKAVSQAPKAKEVHTDQNKMQVDMISELPDHILICILSRLTVEEATVTSILSTRWRHLCTYITHLNFQPLKLGNNSKEKKSLDASSTVLHPSLDKRMKTPEEISTSVDWINHVLDCYNGGHVLKEFRLRVPSAIQVDVEKWLGFALSRGVETLYIHLDRKPTRHYIQLSDKFILDGGSCFNFYGYPIRNVILKDNGCLFFTSLKTLYLHNVDFHVVELELMLSNCVLLETLSITQSIFLENVIKIGGSSLKLKHLEVSRCCPVIHLHDLINLVSFTFKYTVFPGWETFWRVDEKSTPIMVDNVPSLTEIEWIHNSDVKLLSTGLSCCLHQLMKLTLELIKPLKLQNYIWGRSLPKLMNLKYLVLILNMRFESHILELSSLIEASPFLEKLDVQFSWRTPEFKDIDPIDEKLWEHPHNNLKQVRFCNYLGSSYEFEFGLCIFKNAVNLEEFVVEPCATMNDPSQKDQEMSVRRNRAHQQFLARVPKSVKLVIL